MFSRVISLEVNILLTIKPSISCSYETSNKAPGVVIRPSLHSVRGNYKSDSSFVVENIFFTPHPIIYPAPHYLSTTHIIQLRMLFVLHSYIKLIYTRIRLVAFIYIIFLKLFPSCVLVLSMLSFGLFLKVCESLLSSI